MMQKQSLIILVLLLNLNTAELNATDTNNVANNISTNLVVWLKSGTQLAFQTSDVPSIEKIGDTLLITSLNGSMTIANNSVNKITLEAIEDKLTVPLTITAMSYTREYGESNPEFEYIVEGAELEGDPEIICEATTTSAVGEYPIVIKKGSVTNYNDTYVNGTLTITKAPLTISAGTYTIKQGEPLPEFTLSYTGFKNDETSDVLSKQPEVSCEAGVGSAPGEYKVIVSGAEALNYEIAYNNGELIIEENDTKVVDVKIAPPQLHYLHAQWIQS